MQLSKDSIGLSDIYIPLVVVWTSKEVHVVLLEV